MTSRVWCYLAICSLAALAACAGNAVVPATTGAAGGPSGFAARAQGTTTAWGYLYEDPSGKPLAGVAVHLQPWKRGCVKVSASKAVCPGNLPWHATTGRTGRFELVGVPNGDYLLVIGTNLPSDDVHPTIHDHIVLRGGTQHLIAPTLPEVPCVSEQEVVEKYCAATTAPSVTPYPRPAVERHGAYRLVTLSPTDEAPCFDDFNAERVKYHRTEVVLDEWEQELERNVDRYDLGTDITRANGAVPAFTPDYNDDFIGEQCAYVSQWPFVTPEVEKIALDPLMVWFGGSYGIESSG
ncbi:MAG TPA: carboxypeptidase-like regulatory domain-containing protein, partial [Verrucomicrobiae bacterium]|nr:carboxypeptidase-like regulatory domain-containing protein [Verrucomicrobiae bacterium]